MPPADPELTLEQVLEAARALTPDEVDQGWTATFGASKEDTARLRQATEGRSPASAFMIGVLVGRRLAASGPGPAPSMGPDGPYVPPPDPDGG